MANFPTPRVFNAPDEGVPRGIWYRCTETESVLNALMMGLPDGPKRFQLGLVVLIQYRL